MGALDSTTYHNLNMMRRADCMETETILHGNESQTQSDTISFFFKDKFVPYTYHIRELLTKVESCRSL